MAVANLMESERVMDLALVADDDDDLIKSHTSRSLRDEQADRAELRDAKRTKENIYQVNKFHILTHE
jgi:hypothetical protein